MVVVIVILAIALLTVTRMLSQTTLQGAYTYDETKAIELAESLISEIRSKRYDENSPVGGVPPCDGESGDNPCTLGENLGPDGANERATPYNRVAFDDIDDFNGLDEGSGSDTGHSLLNAQGDPRSGYENFRVQIEVSYSGATMLGDSTSTDSKKIRLSITQPNEEVLDFTFHIANY